MEILNNRQLELIEKLLNEKINDLSVKQDEFNSASDIALDLSLMRLDYEIIRDIMTPYIEKKTEENQNIF